MTDIPDDILIPTPDRRPIDGVFSPDQPVTVFLAGIIQGSIAHEDIHAQDWREPIKAALAEHLSPVDVYCHFTAHPTSLAYRGGKIRQTFDEGLRRACEADLVVAYLPSASMGTAVEIYAAWQAGVPILTISPMWANWVLRLYSDRFFADVGAFAAFLASGALCRSEP